MRPSDIRELSPAEFDTRLRELEEELFGLQLKRATSQLENAMKVRQTRRDLARFKTIQRERSAAATQGAGAASERGRGT